MKIYINKWITKSLVIGETILKQYNSEGPFVRHLSSLATGKIIKNGVQIQ